MRKSITAPSNLSVLRRIAVLLIAPASLLLAVACAVYDTAPATFEVRESVQQLQITGAAPGMDLGVYRNTNELIVFGVTDEYGSLMFRELAPESDLLVRERFGATCEENGPHTVLLAAASLPAPSFYSSQVLVPGINYYHHPRWNHVVGLRAVARAARSRFLSHAGQLFGLRAYEAGFSPGHTT